MFLAIAAKVIAAKAAAIRATAAIFATVSAIMPVLSTKLADSFRSARAELLVDYQYGHAAFDFEDRLSLPIVHIRLTTVPSAIRN
jgi:hypothetical protein